MRKLIVTSALLLSLPIVVFAQEPVKVKPPQQKILSSPNGRYVFGQISDFRRDQYLLDTQAGRLWQMVVDKEGKNKLQPVPFIQIWGDEAYIPDPMKEVEGQRKLMLMKRAENLKKLFDSQSQGAEKKQK